MTCCCGVRHTNTYHDLELYYIDYPILLLFQWWCPKHVGGVLIESRMKLQRALPRFEVCRLIDKTSGQPRLISTSSHILSRKAIAR